MKCHLRISSYERAALWPWLAIWFAAVLIRLVYFWQIHDTDLARVLLGDADVYDAWAQRLAAGAWLGDKVFYQAPLYPYFLGIIYKLGGHSLVLVRLVQIAAGACSCVFLGKATEHFISRRAGHVAGVLMALCPTLIFFDCLIQKAVLDVFFLTLALLLAACAARQERAVPWWLALGSGFGLLTLTRENALVMLPLLLAWAWQHGRGRAVLLVVAGTMGVLLPVALRNKLVGGEFHLTTSQMGPNFYIGNNSQADGTYRPLLPGRGDAAYEQKDAVDLAERGLGRKLTPGEVSAFWMYKSLDFIRAEPWQWTKLMARKGFLVWNAKELGDTEEQSAYAAHSPLLRWLSAVLHFGVLCPLAVMGMVWMWPHRRRALWVVGAVALAYAVSVAAFYVFARYRLPLFPMVILLAGGGLAEVRERLRWPLSSSTWKGLAGLIVTAMLVNWPASSDNVDGMVTMQNLGGYFSKRQDYERAIVCYDKVLERIPASAEAHAGKGTALLELNRFNDALPHFETALRLDPEFPDAENNLGNALLRKGDAAAALPHYERALQFKPQSGEIAYNLGNALMQMGNRTAAIESYEKSVQLQPDFADSYNNLGSLLFQVGREKDALEHFRKYAALRPGAAGAHANLGVVLSKTGHTTEAVLEYETALSFDPNQVAALNNLAWILATCPDASVRDGARAVTLASKADEITQQSDPDMLRTLAAALAENGRFPEARQTANAAIRLLEFQGNHALAEAIKNERDFYQVGRPFRELR